MFRNASSRALVSAATISALTLAATTAPHAQAQEVAAEHETLKPEVPVQSDPRDPRDTAAPEEREETDAADDGETLDYFANPFARNADPQGVASPSKVQPNVTVQVLGDILGPYSQHVGFRSGDLGIMAPINDEGEFAMIFGDSFRGASVGQGEWMSPVGVVAKRDENDYVDIQRPLNKGERVKQTLGYLRDGNLTVIPSDIININGTLYLQAMRTRGLHNTEVSQFWKSTDQGQTWQPDGFYYSAMKHRGSQRGMDEMLSWEMGPDGYVYIVTTTFDRNKTNVAPMYLFRVEPENLTNRNAWKMLNLNDGNWYGVDGSGTAILDHDTEGRVVNAGEMNLRYIDGNWVLVLFNETTLQVEVRISKDIDVDWNNVPAVAIAKNGPWSNQQTPSNWSQPYGGYIVPGSSINDMDIVVSQWKTSDNSRYMATQFNVRGLETFYPNLVDESGQPFESIAPRTEFPEKTIRPALPEPTLPVPTSSDSLQTAVIVIGIIASIGALAVFSWPMLRTLLPAQIQDVLPF